MKITNKLKLPDMLQRVVEKDYQYRDKRYSITSLLDSDRVIMLKRRYNNKIKQDVSQCIWMMFGTLTHYNFENIPLHEGELVEHHMEYTFDNGYTLSGIADHIEDYMDDYKTTSVYSVIYKSNYEHWKLQLQMGSYLYYKETGIWLKKGRIIAILKDWNKNGVLQSSNYPKLPVAVIKFDLGTPEKVEKWILDRFERIEYLENLADNDLPLCTPEERFNRGNTYAIIKKGNKRAMKVHETLKEAEAHLKNLNNKYPDTYIIEERLGEDVKCKNYCSVCEFCKYYKKNVKEKKEKKQ